MYKLAALNINQIGTSRCLIVLEQFLMRKTSKFFSCACRTCQISKYFNPQVCQQNVEFLFIKSGGTYSNNWAWRSKQNTVQPTSSIECRTCGERYIFSAYRKFVYPKIIGQRNSKWMGCYGRACDMEGETYMLQYTIYIK